MFNGIQEWISFAVFGIIILGYIVRFFRQVFGQLQPPRAPAPPPVEAEAAAPAPRGQGGGDIQQFLDKIRRGLEEATAQQPAREAAEEERNASEAPPPLPAQGPSEAPHRARREGKKRRQQPPPTPPNELLPQSLQEHLEALQDGASPAAPSAVIGAQRPYQTGRLSRIHRLNIPLRDAILAEVILGPPRSRGPGGASRGQLGAGQRLQAPRRRPGS